jgi:biotin synthase
MIAVTRLVLRNVNIAATTALQALKPDGRELGSWPAQCIMPNTTDTQYRESYKLYRTSHVLTKMPQCVVAACKSA